MLFLTPNQQCQSTVDLEDNLSGISCMGFARCASFIQKQFQNSEGNRKQRPQSVSWDNVYGADTIHQGKIPVTVGLHLKRKITARLQTKSTRPRHESVCRLDHLHAPYHTNEQTDFSNEGISYRDQWISELSPYFLITSATD